jgi:hypothetical protein
MRPLITEMMKMLPNHEEFTWFDLGHMSHPEPTLLNVPKILHYPSDKTALVGIDADGTKFALWMTCGDDGATVGGAVCKRDFVARGAYGSPGVSLPTFKYMFTQNGVEFLRVGTQCNEEVKNAMFKMICDCMVKLHDCTEGYKLTVKQNSRLNKRRLEKGKAPVSYDWEPVPMSPPSRRQCIGHWRNYKSGKRVWVNDFWRGDASKGRRFKDHGPSQKAT